MSKTIMIADDSASMRSLVKECLEGLDVEIIEVTNGYKALKALTQHHFDLMILDINMPEMSGLEVLGFTKKHESYREIRIIIISTDHNEADVKKGLALGADRYLIKPFQMERMRSEVSEMMANDHPIPVVTDRLALLHTNWSQF
ncbi:MAG: response regulator [Nitrospirota bacterium]